MLNVNTLNSGSDMTATWMCVWMKIWDYNKQKLEMCCNTWTYIKEKNIGKIHLHIAAFAHTASSGTVVTDRVAVEPRQQQVKPTHKDFDLCSHTAACSPSRLFK